VPIGGVAPGVVQDRPVPHDAEPVRPGRKLACGLRVVDGAQAGLGREWSFEIAWVTPGRLTVARQRLFRPPTYLTVRIRAVYTPTRVFGWTPWAQSVNPGAPVVQVRTATAVLDWVIEHPEDFRWATELVQPEGAVRVRLEMPEL